MPKTYAVPPAPPANEGNTLAAWTLTALVVLGAVVAAVGMVATSTLMMGIGAAVVALGILAGIGLAAAGKGQKRGRAAQQ